MSFTFRKNIARCLKNNLNTIALRKYVYSTKSTLKSGINSKNKPAKYFTGFIWCGGFYKFLEKPDSIDKDLVEKNHLKFIEDDAELTPMDRVKRIFQRDEYSLPSPALAWIYDLSLLTGLGGFVFGGGKEAIETYKDFIHYNKATQFENIIVAKRKISDRVVLGFTRVGIKSGLKCFILTSMFLLTGHMITEYRMKNSVFNYTLAGSLTGAVMSIRHGPRTSVLAAILTAGLGTFYGFSMSLIQSVSGHSLADIQKEQYLEMRRDKERDLALKRESVEGSLYNDDSVKNIIEEQLKSGNYFPVEEEKNTDTKGD